MFTLKISTRTNYSYATVKFLSASLVEKPLLLIQPDKNKLKTSNLSTRQNFLAVEIPATSC